VLVVGTYKVLRLGTALKSDNLFFFFDPAELVGLLPLLDFSQDGKRDFDAFDQGFKFDLQLDELHKILALEEGGLIVHLHGLGRVGF